MNVIPWWLRGKESACSVGDLSSISGLGSSPGEENGSPLQYACLENPMDREAWWASIESPRVGHTVRIHFHFQETNLLKGGFSLQSLCFLTQ